MKAIICALFAGVVVSVAHAGENPISGAPKLDAQAQCKDDVATLWLYGYMHKQGRITYEQVAHNNATAFSTNSTKRERLDRLAELAYRDPRFGRFADAAFAANIQATCTAPGRRFDPFSWHGKNPPDQAS